MRRRAEKARDTFTVSKAHSIYSEVIKRRDRSTLKPRTLADKAVILTRDIGPRLGSKSLSDLTENACWDAVYDKAKSSKDRANKLAGELSCFLRWCSEGEHALPER